MYKIYIHNNPIYLVQTSEIAQLEQEEKNSKALKIAYDGQKKLLQQCFEQLEQNQVPQTYFIVASDVEKLRQDFWSLFNALEAAGGVVFQQQSGKILGIYRRGSWDLPKGKREKGESREQGAIREVQEETGIQQIELGDFLTTTYHTYRGKKNSPILKISHWYKMTTPETDLHPQTEEDIEQATWLALSDFLAQKPIYPNIVEVLKQL